MPAVGFDAFMRAALYHPERGYYRRARDPFGVHGDFFTASQLQPLFGNIVAAEAHVLEPGSPVFELGAGRREMASAFPGRYTGLEIGDPLPDDLSGFVFANEFFDALPVRAGIVHEGQLRERMVLDSEWTLGPELDVVAAAYARRYWPHAEEGGCFEIGLEALEWIDRLSRHMRRGHALIIDYGYSTRETVRFPQGTLMSYRRHVAGPDVLSHPGERDITAHVAFDALLDRALETGFELVRRETLARFVLRAIERDPALAEGSAAKKQLKTLLFSMGESFTCLLLRRLER